MIVDSGYDLICKSASQTASRPAAADQMALTADTAVPATTDTVLASEIATASGGLIRAQATFAKSSTKVFTLTKVFTSNGSDVLPVVVAKFGVFNAAVSGGTLAFEFKFAAAATLSAIGDSVTVTETVTFS